MRTSRGTSPSRVPPSSIVSRVRGTPMGFELEVTARCNNDCRHCFINLPAADAPARSRELTFTELVRIAGEAADLGCLWCLVSGGEPLLRDDFSELYLALRRTGLLLSVFTNACLVREGHVRLFRDHPPRDVEVTVYGAAEDTYERVTQRPRIVPRLSARRRSPA